MWHEQRWWLQQAANNAAAPCQRSICNAASATSDATGPASSESCNQATGAAVTATVQAQVTLHATLPAQTHTPPIEFKKNLIKKPRHWDRHTSLLKENLLKGHKFWIQA